MRIVVVSTPIFSLGPKGLSGYGGLEQVSWECAKGLATKGHQVSLVAPSGSICPGCEIWDVGRERTVSEQMAYDKYWERLVDVDVIIDHSWNKWAYVGKQEGWLKAPVLGVLHAPVNTMYQSLPPVEKPCFVCISQDQCNHFNALFSPAQAKVCYNGIDLDFYKPMQVPRSRRFLFLARFSTIKGPRIAQQACKEASVGLDLVGDTTITNEPEYFEECKRAADGKQIRLVGPANRGGCVWWYSQSRGLIHANKLFREPFGLAPIEAQACETPILAWDYGAMRETINQGETGFLIRSFDEMVEVLKSGVLDQLNREHCREWAHQFSVDRMVARYEELCVEAMDTGGW